MPTAASMPGVNASSSTPDAITISNLPAAGSAGNHFAERVGSLAGSVYLDANNDGTRQGGESGIAGVTVTLSGNDITGTAVSRSRGHRRVGQLPLCRPAGRRPRRLHRHRAVGAAGRRRGDHAERPDDRRHHRGGDQRHGHGREPRRPARSARSRCLPAATRWPTTSARSCRSACRAPSSSTSTTTACRTLPADAGWLGVNDRHHRHRRHGRSRHAHACHGSGR